MTLHARPQLLRLTPLTPVHIGCGEDFEPTNYVVEDGLLFHFDPALVRLVPKEREELMRAVERSGDEAIRSVQRFFHERRTRYAAGSRLVVALAPGVARQHVERVGQVAQHESGGRRVQNRLEIERTMHHPHTGVPYLPGSSLKGAIRTAWLDQVNGGRSLESGESRGRGSQALERRLLGGAFDTDPFRMLRVSDAAGPGVRSQVVFCVNRKKRQVFKDGRELTGQGPAARRETILGAQYRAFACEMRIATPRSGGGRGEIRPDRAIADATAVAKACNRFYLRRLESELSILDSRRFCSEAWVRDFRGLVDALRPALESGRVMLLRIGRHSGAESVTLDGVRLIRIRKGRGRPAEDRDESTTLWLAADEEDARSGMWPLGWLLAETEGNAEIPELKDWCERQPRPDFAGVEARVEALRASARADNERAEAAASARREEEASAARRESERQALAARLSPNGRLVEALRERFERHQGPKQPVSGVLYAEVVRLLKAASTEEWTAEDRLSLAELVSGLGNQKIDFGGKTKEIKRTVAALREGA